MPASAGSPIRSGVNPNSTSAPIDNEFVGGDASGGFRHNGEASNFLFVGGNAATFGVEEANTVSTVGQSTTPGPTGPVVVTNIWKTADDDLEWGAFSNY